MSDKIIDQANQFNNKHNEKWYSNSTLSLILTFLLSLILGINTLINTWYNHQIQVKEQQIRQEEVNLKKADFNLQNLKLLREDFASDKQDLLLHTQTLSNLQIKTVELQNYFTQYKFASEAEKKKVDFYNVLANKEQEREKLLAKFTSSCTLIQYLYGEDAYEKAKFFIRKQKEFSDPNTPNQPTENDWIKWQDAIVRTMVEHLQKKYNTIENISLKGD